MPPDYIETQQEEENSEEKSDENKMFELTETIEEDENAKDTFKTTFSEEDSNIYEKFIKLKKEEDEKANRLKKQQKMRMLEELKENEEKVAKNRNNRVRFVSNEDIFSEGTSTVRVVNDKKTDTKKRSYDFDKDEYIDTDSVKSSIISANNTSNITIENEIEDENEDIKNIKSIKTIKNNSSNKDIKEINEVNTNEDEEVGFDFLDRFKR